NFICSVQTPPMLTIPGGGGSTQLSNMKVSYKDYDGSCSANGGCNGGIITCLNVVDLNSGHRDVLACVNSDTQPSNPFGASVAIPNIDISGTKAYWISVQIHRATTAAGVDFHGVALTL